MKEAKNDKMPDTKDELSKKVETIMGPTPENANTTDEKTPEKYKQDTSNSQPKSAPPLKGGKKMETRDVESAPESKQKINQEEPAEDKELDDAVDDIAENEADEILEAQDKEVEKAFKADEKSPNWLQRFWRNKPARRIVFGVIFLVILAAGIYPTSRYYILNTVGVRSNASIKIIDSSTQQPLKNVKVTLGESSAESNDQGVANLSNVLLGEQTMIVERKAFAKLEQPITVGWGSNPLGDVSIKPTGLQYAIKVQDLLSTKAIEKAEAYTDDASAFSDKDGKILLTLDNKGDEPVNIKVRAGGYREETIKDDGSGSDKETVVKMVADKKQLFITKRSGKYDVYKIDVDGKNEELVLSETGSERNDITLSSHPSGETSALVSSRDNIRTDDGVLKNTLTMIEVETNKTQPVDSSERIQIAGWIDNQLVYVKVDETKKKNGVSTHTLISYDHTTDTKTVIASDMFFNDVELAGNRIYFAPAAEIVEGTEDSDSPKVNRATLGLFSTDSLGRDKKTVINKEIWSITRNDYNTLVLGSGKDWYEFTLSSSQPSKLDGPPATETGRIYVDNQKGDNSLWVDKRDGKGVLLAYNVSKNKDKVLATLSGLTNPVRWLNDTTATFRVETEEETADYAISLNGGEARKITDVTSTKGAESWYYY
jgi:hypothetical protein